MGHFHNDKSSGEISPVILLVSQLPIELNNRYRCKKGRMAVKGIEQQRQDDWQLGLPHPP